MTECSRRRSGATLPLAATLYEARNLAQPLEREQRCGVHWGRSRWCTRIVGGTHGERCMGPVQKLDDQVRINTLSDPDQLDLLTAQRVMWMGDRDRCRRRLGQGGSVL